MKKFFLFAAALCAAVSINAKVIDIDLSSATPIAFDDCSATPSFEDGVLNVEYTAGGWQWAGVEIALDNLEVQGIDFDYKGLTESWTSFVVYLRADDGARWYDESDDFSLSHEDWFSKADYFPSQLLWDVSEYALGERPFIALGFLANPMEASSGSFAIRNVKLTVADAVEAIENVESQAKAVKVIRDGQVLILRDGKTFNALGSEMK